MILSYRSDQFSFFRFGFGSSRVRFRLCAFRSRSPMALVSLASICSGYVSHQQLVNWYTLSYWLILHCTCVLIISVAAPSIFTCLASMHAALLTSQLQCKQDYLLLLLPFTTTTMSTAVGSSCNFRIALRNQGSLSGGVDCQGAQAYAYAFLPSQPSVVSLYSSFIPPP